MPSPLATLDHRDLYRLPWSLSDNVIAWLEPTKQCNIYCDGCYSANAKGSHKTLAQIAADLDVFERYRKTDAVSIAGGDPLTHPDVVEIVRMVARRGLKPVVNTNGYAMTPSLVRELRTAGMVGVTFHVDSRQRRPGWTGKNELELNALRQQFADMVAEVGGISCAFNSTVYEETLASVPEIVDWARQNPAKVQVVVFIAFRTSQEDRFDYYVGGQKVDPGELVYVNGRTERKDIHAREIAARINDRFPGFRPAAYLNGTEKADSFKWLMTLVLNDGEEIIGSVGPRFVELAQVGNHLLRGRYLGYTGPGTMAGTKLMLPLGAAVDPGMRAAGKRWLARALRDPRRLARPVYMQSIMIIQPVDLLEDGRASMCDGCPDITVHEGELVWSCRLDERMRYGDWIRLVPRKKDAAAPGKASA